MRRALQCAMMLGCAAVCARCFGASAPRALSTAQPQSPSARQSPSALSASPPRPRYALFWDADNVAPAAVRRVLAALDGVGVDPDIRRAYGDVCNKHSSQWRGVFAEEGFAVTATYPVSAQKNGADMELALDVLETILSGRAGVRTVIVVSSDSDFVPLARRARALGAAYWGFGSTATGRAYRAACSRFFVLDEGGLAPARRTRKGPPPPPPRDPPGGTHAPCPRTPPPTPAPRERPVPTQQSGT